MGKRCQVCDGPIVNGRCKYCGMPYRNDMELYHLNEDRSEHYRHASAKERKVMAESEIPLPDRNKKTQTKKNAGSRVSVGGTQTSKAQTYKTLTSQKQTSKAQTGKTPAAVRRTANTQTTHTYHAGQSTVQNKKQKKKSKKGMWIFWIFLAAVVVMSEYTPDNLEYIGYKIESFVEDKFGIQLDNFLTGSDADRIETKESANNVEDVAYSEEELYNYDCVYIDTDGGAYTIGETYAVTEDDADTEDNGTDIENEMVMNPGEYVFESGWEEVALKITDSAGETKTVKFDKSNQQKKVELHTKDQIEAVSLDGQYNYLAMYEIQQYDE